VRLDKWQSEIEAAIYEKQTISNPRLAFVGYDVLNRPIFRYIFEEAK
jgi:dsRNA-specific ribonuclease